MKKTITCLAIMLGVLGSGVALAQTSSVSIEDDALGSPNPTTVWGEAANASGGDNAAEIIQNANDGNPLGAPVIDMNAKPTIEKTAPAGVQPPAEVNAVAPSEGMAPIYQSTEQGVEKPWQEPLPQPSNKIENELYQSGNDIIDVQAYPTKDVSTVTTPNIQPTIITQ